MPPARATFTEGVVSRHIAVVASTSALSLLAVFLVDILTLLYVTQLGDQALVAAVGLVKTLIFINGAFSSGLVIAAGALLSERVGKHAAKGLGRLVSHMLIMVLLMSGLIAAVELACTGPIFRALGGTAASLDAARHFIWMALPASVLISAMQMCAQLLRSQGHVRLALWVLLGGAATVALADPLLIFGLHLGLDGAGMSAVLGAALPLAAGLLLVKRHIGLSTAINGKLLWLHLRRVMRVALPLMLGNLAMPVGITYLMVVLAAQGTSALAGMAVVDRVLQFAYCMFFALPGALVPVLAQNIGAHLDQRVREAIGAARKLVLFYGFSIWLLLIVSGPRIADYFQLLGSGREMFLAFCHVGAGLWIVFGLDFVAQAMFLTMGRAWCVPAFGWLRGTLGSLPFVYVGDHWAGGSGALAGIWSGNALVALLAIYTAARQARQFFRRRLLAITQ